MGEVRKFEPEVVGDAFRFDCDELLEAAKNQGFDRLVIIADYLEGSDIWISGSANAGESMILMERAKRHIVEGD
jgi:hypothetical protein